MVNRAIVAVGVADGDCAVILAAISAAPIATTITTAIAFAIFIFPPCLSEY
jgi:hypothetical protein